jgi:hypothetical protein
LPPNASCLGRKNSVNTSASTWVLPPEPSRADNDSNREDEMDHCQMMMMTILTMTILTVKPTVMIQMTLTQTKKIPQPQLMTTLRKTDLPPIVAIIHGGRGGASMAKANNYGK